MKVALITDAWEPQVNGVVTTLVELVREMERAGHQIEVIHPGQFRTRPARVMQASTWRCVPERCCGTNWTHALRRPSISQPKDRWAG